MNRSELLNDGNFSKTDEILSNNFNATGEIIDDDPMDIHREIDDWVILTYFTFIGIGALINAGIITGLLRCKRKGKVLYTYSMFYTGYMLNYC